MSSSEFVTHIRSAELVIDTEFELKIGVYGPDFWNGIAAGQYEQDTFDFLDSRARNGSRVLVDVGSATGCMVLYAASLGMQAIGTEPQKLVFESLRRNVELNPSMGKRIHIHHALVGIDRLDTGQTDKLFTEGANGPLKKEIVPTQISLKTLVDPFEVSDKISIKIDIEGAEYYLLSEKETLQALKSKKATVFLSFHPGFNRNLGNNPSLARLTIWRIATMIETLAFVRKIQKFGSFSNLRAEHKLSLFAVIALLVKDQKDFVVTF
jgi:FkbM family methyltransferase